MLLPSLVVLFLLVSYGWNRSFGRGRITTHMDRVEGIGSVWVGFFLSGVGFLGDRSSITCRFGRRPRWPRRSLLFYLRGGTAGDDGPTPIHLT